MTVGKTASPQIGTGQDAPKHEEKAMFRGVFVVQCQKKESLSLQYLIYI